MENFQGRGSGSGLQKFMDPDPEPVCPERLDPDPVNIRPDPNPCWWLIDFVLIFCFPGSF